jgi:hypothetical protein
MDDEWCTNIIEALHSSQAPTLLEALTTNDVQVALCSDPCDFIRVPVALLSQVLVSLCDKTHTLAYEVQNALVSFTVLTQ